MSLQKLAIGSVVGAIVLFVLGYVLFNFLLMDYYQANAGVAGIGLRESEISWAILVGSLGYGALITYLIGKHAQGSTLAGGLQAGALAGFLLWLTADFMIYGFLDLWNLNVTVVDVVVETIRAAITGAVVAVVLSKLPA